MNMVFIIVCGYCHCHHLYCIIIIIVILVVVVHLPLLLLFIIHLLMYFGLFVGCSHLYPSLYIHTCIDV